MYVVFDLGLQAFEELVVAEHRGDPGTIGVDMIEGADLEVVVI